MFHFGVTPNDVQGLFLALYSRIILVVLRDAGDQNLGQFMCKASIASTVLLLQPLLMSYFK